MSTLSISILIVMVLGALAGIGYGLYYLFAGGNAYIQADPVVMPSVTNNVASIPFITSGKCVIPCTPTLDKLTIFDVDQTTVVETVYPGFQTLEGPDSENRWVGTVQLPSFKNLKLGWGYLAQATLSYGRHSTVGPQFHFSTSFTPQ